MTAYIPLSNTKFAVVDLEDLPKLLDYVWCNNGNGYARTTTGIYMHRLLLDAQIVDHINRNRLDNRKCNLRPSTFSKNNINRLQTPAGRYRGVYQRTRNCYQAKIKINGKALHLGSFKTSIEAAKVYDKAALQYHGEAAILNFPKEKI